MPWNNSHIQESNLAPGNVTIEPSVRTEVSNSYYNIQSISYGLTHLGFELAFELVLFHGVTSSIPGTSTNFKCDLGLERGPPSLVRTIKLLDWEIANLIKKVDFNRLDAA